MILELSTEQERSLQNYDYIFREMAPFPLIPWCPVVCQRKKGCQGKGGGGNKEKSVM